MNVTRNRECSALASVPDDRFSDVETAARTATVNGQRFRVLLLADDAHQTEAVSDHIDAIRRYSRHDVLVLNPIELRRGWTIAATQFDALVIHYSISILGDYFLAPPVRKLVREFRGPKIQIIQDECRWVDRMTLTMADLGISAVFSSLTLDNLRRVYHHPHLSNVRFYSSLPGYVSERYLNKEVPPISARPFHLVYRGQELLPQYGLGAREKMDLGEQATRMVMTHGLTADIKTGRGDRVFGEDWVRHLISGKAVLATEGGVSVFDFDESVEQGVSKYRMSHPEASWQEIWDKVVRPYEGNVVHRTITPRVFESIMCRTALVMYPGEFRGLLEPWNHYIPLQRDGSNEEEVARFLRDDQYLQALADRAYHHIANDPNLQFPIYSKAIDKAVNVLAEENHIVPHLVKARLPVVTSVVRQIERRANKAKQYIDMWIEAFGLMRRADWWVAKVLSRYGQDSVPMASFLFSTAKFAVPSSEDLNDKEPYNILVICDFGASSVGTVRDHLDALRKYSRHRTCFVDWRSLDQSFLCLDVFDIVVLHYSVIIANDGYMRPTFVERLARFPGYKVLFIQDEYRWVDRTVAAIAKLEIDVIYSVINEDVRDRIYHHESIRNVRRKTTLTGFVPEPLTKLSVPDFKDRPIDVGYRVRRLRASLGAFGQEKWQIGDRFRKDARRFGLCCNIEYEERKRIYGRKWIDFVSSCKAMLGSESGVSFVDFDGTVQPLVDAYEDANQHESIAAIQRKFLGTRDGEHVIRVISPRCFEAASLRTLMILYPGEYSGILEPWRHYVPLERDHSNMDEVVSVLRDAKRAGEIIERAYKEVALNPRYSFRNMVEDFDKDLRQYVHAKVRSSTVGIATLGGDLDAREERGNSLLHTMQKRALFDFYCWQLLRLTFKHKCYVALRFAVDVVVPARFQTVVWRHLKRFAMWTKIASQP